MAKAKGKKKAKKKARKAAKGKKKRTTARATKPKRKSTAKRKKTTAKRKKTTAKPKRKAPAKKKAKRAAAGGTAKLKADLKRWQQLHGQLQQQLRAKDSTISMQMQEIMDLKKALEDLRPGPMQWRP